MNSKNEFKELSKFENLNKNFESFEKIGSGGYGFIYSGIFKKNNKRYAIKILNLGDDLDRKRIDQERFKNEINILKVINSPNIVRILGSYISNNECYYAMELIDGQSLKSIIAKQSKIDVQSTVNYSKEICMALEKIHDKNIIHRDLKPSNILIENGTNVVKLIDFGISLSENSNRVTAENKAVGSIQYLAPEILSRKSNASIKSDIYSLGIMMYEMFTGRVPFNGSDQNEVMLAHINDDLPPINEKNNIVIPQALENIIIKCTAKYPDQRYENVKEIYEDLEMCLSAKRSNDKKINLNNKTIKKDTPTFRHKKMLTIFLSIGGILIAIVIVLLILLLKGVIKF